MRCLHGEIGLDWRSLRLAQCQISPVKASSHLSLFMCGYNNTVRSSPEGLNTPSASFVTASILFVANLNKKNFGMGKRDFS